MRGLKTRQLFLERFEAAPAKQRERAHSRNPRCHAVSASLPCLHDAPQLLRMECQRQHCPIADDLRLKRYVVPCVVVCGSSTVFNCQHRSADRCISGIEERPRYPIVPRKAVGKKKW